MTDFDAKARGLRILASGCGNGPYDQGPCPADHEGPCDCANKIAAALKAAYTQGYSDCEQAIADTVRAKKVPT